MSPILTEPPPGPLRRIAMVARWRPVHRIHAAILRGLCQRADRVVIGIGSSNRYNAANPFTPAETAEMIRLVVPDMEDRLELLEIPDLGDGPRWAEMVRHMMAPLDLFVSANAWVRDLVAEFWPVVHPIHFIPEQQRAPISGTRVRQAMARDEAWQELVPGEVAAYIQSQELDTRLRLEFGDEIWHGQG